MFATIRRYQGNANQIDDVIKRVQQGLVPILTRQKGFLSYSAIDAGNGVALSFSTYQDKASAEAANDAAAQWVQQNLKGLVTPLDVTVGEVRVSATAAHV